MRLVRKSGGDRDSIQNDSLLPDQLTSRLGTALLELWDGPRMPPGIPSEQNQDETC